MSTLEEQERKKDREEKLLELRHSKQLNSGFHIQTVYEGG